MMLFLEIIKWAFISGCAVAVFVLPVFILAWLFGGKNS